MDSECERTVTWMNSNHFVDPNINSGRFSEPEELERDYTEIKYDCFEEPVRNKAAGV